MPTKTRSFKTVGKRRFDARPDRIDFRDYDYRPRLASLPTEYPDATRLEGIVEEYTKTLILDQGAEGACTGFGLAAVINYLLFRRSVQARQELGVNVPVQRVSARMLYHMARIYDEWPGEDYDGSSCRGAMKGWHRHGVCTDVTWPYLNEREEIAFVRPRRGWQSESAQVPLGAYYRVSKDSIVDMQAALYEVGALYCSATVHDGWSIEPSDSMPTIGMPADLGETGGHAFAIVGYDADGFIVQNSWGAAWGYYGFARLPYRDWVEHGVDAWVAVLGAPVSLQKSRHSRVDLSVSRTRSAIPLQEAASGRAEWFWRKGNKNEPYAFAQEKAAPLSEGQAYEHTVVLGNNGRPINSFLDLANEDQAIVETVYRLPLERLKNTRNPKLMIYAHGGLNNEKASIQRIRRLAPYFIHNGVHPIFITWRTGVLESLGGILEDAYVRMFKPDGQEISGGVLDSVRNALKRVKDQLAEARDRAVEVASERFLVKPVWMQMKQNARAAERGGLVQIAKQIRRLVDELGSLEIHLVGHSAGSILHGHLLERLVTQELPVTSCTLFAAACSVRFGLDHYGPHSRAVKGGFLSKHDVFHEVLSDDRERSDAVGPYGKSLLYLVSRALEDVHKMPILGMEGVWDRAAEREDMWYLAKGERENRDVKDWRSYVRGLDAANYRVLAASEIDDGQGMIPSAHGTFDNDVDVMTRTIKRITGRRRLALEVETLRGF